MNRRDFLKTSGAAVALLSRAQAQVTASGIMAPVLTRNGDNYRTCSNTRETILNQANVAKQGIKRYFSLPLEGDARGTEGQVLILPSVRMDDGSTRDVAVVSEMNNLVWGFDANNSDILWSHKIAKPIKGNGSIDMFLINDWWGILSTGVIDPDTQRYFCVAWAAPDGNPDHGTHAIHCLNIRNGNRVGEAVSLADLTYTPPNGLPSQRYNATKRKQRSGLALATVGGRKTLFFASGSVLETQQGASGWMIAYDIDSGALTPLALSSRYYGSGIWMAGSGVCVDDEGYIWAVTGNGGFDGITDFSEAVIKVKYTPPGGSTPGKLEVADDWAPYTDAGRVGKDPTLATPQGDVQNYPKIAGVSAPTAEGNMPVNMMPDHDLSGPQIGKRIITKPNPKNTTGFGDEDLGSAGLSLIPEYRIALACGKDGVAYEVNMDNLGHTKPADFRNSAANYAKLKQPPYWYTYYPCDTDDCTGIPSAAPADPSDLDFVFERRTHHMHSTSVRYKSSVHGMMLFCGGENGNVRAFTMAPDGKLTFLANSQEVASANAPVSNTQAGGMTGWMMFLSADGAKAGTALLWALTPYGDANKTVSPGRLICYDPENFDKFPNGAPKLRVLWDSEQWNIQFSFNKFNPPTVSGGKVFIPTYDGRIDVYWLA
jgi:hypothetical protein